MVTGIEAAGLALGLFPLVIEGIDFYIIFAQKFKETRHYKHTLNKFRIDVKMEISKFNNMWYTLMCRARVPIKPNMEFSPEIMGGVLSCLPPWAIESFVNGYQELHTILKELKEKFYKYEQDKAGYRQMLGMLRDFTQEDRAKYLERLDTLNSNLDKLVNGAPPRFSAEANKSRKVNVARQYLRVREHAITLYGALKERLQISSCPSCLCKIPNTANLQLDVCILGTHNGRIPGMGRLSLLFPVPLEQAKTEEFLTLRELEFENLENQGSVEYTSDSVRVMGSELFLQYKFEQDPTTLQLDVAYMTGEQKTVPDKNPLSRSSVKSKLRGMNPFKKNPTHVESCPPVAVTISSCVETTVVPSAPERIIECLCSAIRNIAEMCTCVGVLVSNDSKHLVWDPGATLAKLASARVVSLADLLSLPEPPRRERLKLGVRLASSVLQLHRTEWLQERWGKQDICLIQEGSSKSSSPSLETPVVCRTFTSEHSVLEASIESRIICCNLSLFSLGIVLIELWFWRSEESFQVDKPQHYCCLEDLDTARFIRARRMIDKMYGDAGENYGNIVRRCIIGLDHKETRLDNDEFKNEVYLKIQQPLEKHLELFCDESLGEIFMKRVP